MKFKKIALAFGLGHSRVSRLKTSRSSNRKLVFSSLEFELEKRQLLVTFVVDNLNNSGTGSLRQAIADAIVVNNGTLTAQNSTINGATGATADTPTVYIGGGSVSLSNNTLTLGNGARYLLFNNATANVSAISNTWNGVNTSTANLSQLYDTVDRIIDSVDVSSLGLVRIKANNVYVTKKQLLCTSRHHCR